VPTLNNVENTDYWTAYVPNVLNGLTPLGNSTDNDGYYYSWNAAMTVCTDPWRLPSDSDFGNLLAAVPSGFNNLTDTVPDVLIDFNAKKAGQIHPASKAVNRGRYAFWWSSTTIATIPSYRYWQNWGATDTLTAVNEASGYSVRCLKDI
jgi:uncharacterized protein (TIGR02145 family)